MLENMSIILPSMLIQIRINILSKVKTDIQNTATLIIMPTEKCNFRCTYCYETFEKGKMKQKTGEAIKKYLAREVPKHKNYQLAWFGGEPLLQPQIIWEICEVFEKIKKLHNVSGTTSITTNGFLLKKPIIKKLSSVGVSVYHITVDGPKNLHDNQRVQTTGNPTYETILNNIHKIFKHSDARVVLRININPQNKQLSETITDWIENTIMTKFSYAKDRLNFYIMPIWNATTQSIEGICLTNILDFQQYAKVKNQALKSQGSSLRKDLGKMLNTTGSLSCYAGKPNSYVIGSDGSVYKCTVAVDLPENQIGKIQDDGFLDLDDKKENLWTHGNALTDKNCGNCNFSNACQGIFCPLVRLQTKKSPCPTEKHFANEIINSY